jgi:hypothetical protein
MAMILTIMKIIPTVGLHSRGVVAAASKVEVNTRLAPEIYL